MYRVKDAFLYLDKIGQFREGDEIEDGKIKQYSNFDMLVQEKLIEEVFSDGEIKVKKEKKQRNETSEKAEKIIPSAEEDL